MANNYFLSPPSPGGKEFVSEDIGAGVQMANIKVHTGAANVDGGAVILTNPFFVALSDGTTKALVGVSGELQTSSGGINRTAVAAGAGTAVEIIKASAGRLCRVLVTANASAVLDFYDNPSAASGVIIGSIKATAVKGDIYVFDMPATTGIVAAQISGSPAVTVSWD